MSPDSRNRLAGNETVSKVLADGLNRSNPTAIVTSCVEVDLRGIEPTSDRLRYARFALDGIEPGDTVKIIVDRRSVFCFHDIDFTGVRVQITADSVWTRKSWEQQFAEVVR